MKVKRIVIIAIMLCGIFIWKVGPWIWFIAEYDLMSYEEVIAVYEENEMLLNDISFALDDLPYSYISIDSDDYSEGMYVNVPDDTMGEMIEIEDEALAENIASLFTKPVQHVTKEDNGIFFMMSSFLDYCKGVAYSLDGDIPKSYYDEGIEHLHGRWYYYENRKRE